MLMSMMTSTPVLFAYAEPNDLSASGWLLILECGGVILGMAVLVIVPMAVATLRGHRQQEIVNTIAFFWGLVAAWSTVWLTISEFNWKKEWRLRIMTGYMDPRDTTGAPPWPWTLWTTLMIVYGALLVFALASTTRVRSPEATAPGDTLDVGVKKR
jgi:hypothetical protein